MPFTKKWCWIYVSRAQRSGSEMKIFTSYLLIATAYGDYPGEEHRKKDLGLNLEEL